MKVSKDFWALAGVVAACVALCILSALTVGCAQPAMVEHTRYAVNSAWEIVYISQYETQAPRLAELTDSSLDQVVTSYNQATTDDQLSIFEDEIPPIEEAPAATVFICADADLSIMWQGSTPRADLIERREAWRGAAAAMSDCYGNMVPSTLYVDRIPDFPPVLPEPDLYVTHAVYWIRQSDGAVMYEFHEADYNEFIARYNGAVSGVFLHNRDNPDDPWYYIVGRLYIPGGE